MLPFLTLLITLQQSSPFKWLSERASSDFSCGDTKQSGLWRVDFSLKLTEEVSLATGSSRVVMIIYSCLAKWSI